MSVDKRLQYTGQGRRAPDPSPVLLLAVLAAAGRAPCAISPMARRKHGSHARTDGHAIEELSHLEITGLIVGSSRAL